MLATIAGGAFASRSLAANRYYDGPVSDHFNGTHFFNPNGEEPNSFFELLRWQLGGGRAAWPVDWPSPFPSAVPEARIEGERLVELELTSPLRMTTHMGVVRMRDRMVAPGAELLISMLMELAGGEAAGASPAV